MILLNYCLFPDFSLNQRNPKRLVAKLVNQLVVEVDAAVVAAGKINKISVDKLIIFF